MVMNTKNKEKLFSEFAPISRDQWEEQIAKDLKGGDYKSLLKWETFEGISPLPFYLREDTEPLPDYGPEKRSTLWNICEPIFRSEPEEIRKEIQNSLAGGATSIIIRSTLNKESNPADGKLQGAQIHTQTDFNLIFDEIDLSGTSLMFDSGFASPEFVAMLLNNTDPFYHAGFIFDPFTESAKTGRLENEANLRNFISQLSGLKNIHSLAADGLFYHKAGATIVQEIAISLSIASEYLALAEQDRKKTAAGSIFVRLSAGPLYFPEIAKLRALRYLWKNLLKAYKTDDTIPLFIHSETTPQNKTVTDRHNNMLRVTTEAMGAAIGGADSLVINPYDECYQKPDTFSKRIARNIHHILREEAHLDKTTDPAAGSYYIEQLTDQIASNAWDYFREIEDQGGFAEALKSGFIQAGITESRRQKSQAYATRKRTLTGTNNYPNPDEDLPDKIEIVFDSEGLRYTDKEARLDTGQLISSLQEHLKEGYTVGDLIKARFNQVEPFIDPLEEFHAGDLFDSIRLKTDEMAKKSGHLPTVTIVPAGKLKWRNARASFAQNLLGCAGFNIDRLRGFDSIEEAISNTDADKSDVIVLCSSDDEYANFASSFCKLFKNRSVLILAGKPGEMEQKYRSEGIDDFIYSGMDAVEFLSNLQKRIFKSEGIK